MEVVAGTTLSALEPRVWSPESEYYLPQLNAIMISYADFYKRPVCRQRAMEQGLHDYLGISKDKKVYLDNGSFYFIRKGGKTPRKEYREFVRNAKPDWFPIAQDFIPTPKMTSEEQLACLAQTMDVNYRFRQGRYVPVIHISSVLEEYVRRLKAYDFLEKKEAIALGGIVPNLLRAPKAMHPQKVLENLVHVRKEFENKKLHVFGIGGTATLHIAALLKINSADSSGWRNRAARGLIQLPGTGDRMVAELGSWRGRRPSMEEWEKLEACKCPACQKHGVEGLKASKTHGFRNRATHNLWVLLEEIRLVEAHCVAGDYETWYSTHLDNTLYRPVIKKILDMNMEKNNHPHT